jgi:AraC-like DNA-binding protein
MQIIFNVFNLAFRIYCVNYPNFNALTYFLAFSPSLLADLLGCSKSTAYRIAKNEGLCITVGGRKVIFRRDYENWLLQKKDQALHEIETTVAHKPAQKSGTKAQPIQRKTA